MSVIGWIVPELIAGFIASKIVTSRGQGFWTLRLALSEH